jgi:predicted XRE-type DNA-binding protein
MDKLSAHWTEETIDDFVYRIGADYIQQIENAMEHDGVKQSELATALGVTEGRISQVLNNPGNLTLRKIVEYARALGKKVSVISYSDGDAENQNGPINPEIFVTCWERSGRPKDFFALREGLATAANVRFAVVDGDTYRYAASETADNISGMSPKVSASNG